ncbi:glucose-6-phosphate isomerase family protein [Patescibacteria group bacterium]
MKNIKPNIRHLKDMKEVIFDKDWLKTANPDLELYYMYRGLDENEKDNLRYDITVLKSLMLGKEYNKTAGHIHSDYTENYEVLEGEAIFLMQKIENNKIKDVYAVKAKATDKITIPLNYSHIMINIGNSDLKTSNWINKDCVNVYDYIKQKQGLCYFAIKENGELKWIKNKNYSNIPELRFE